MPAALKRKSSWAEPEVLRPLAALLVSLACFSATAQEPSLRLRPSETLSAEPPSPPAPTEADVPALPLGLTLSRELVPVRPSVPPQAPEVAEVLFQVDVNRQGINETVVFLRLADGRFLVAEDDLERWRIRPPSGVP